LAALTSFDANEGIRRIGGKADAYRKQLRRFREHYPNAAAELRRLATSEGARRAEEYCHALKGVTGNLGAAMLYERITAIDEHLKQNRLPDDATIDELADLLRRAMSEIDHLATPASHESAPAGEPLPPGVLRDLLARLTHALEFDLGAAEPLLTQLRTGVAGTSLESDIAILAALADDFDIDGALAKLRELDTTLAAISS
jgi:HPt (histidine-containing phosphotransfer) domain-containing protein